MINCETLKKEIASFNYHKELEKIECAPIVNEAFPEDFNYSIGEASVFRKFGHYVPIEKNWSFSLVQPCVRLTDFYKELIKKILLIIYFYLKWLMLAAFICLRAKIGQLK